MIKKHSDKILFGICLLLGIVAIILLVAPGISPKAEYKDIPGATSYSMAQITFGHKINHPILGEVEVFKFSFPNLLTYILIVAGLACAVAALLGKGGKIVPFVAAGLLLVAGILYFCAGKLLNLAGEDSGTMTIGIGSILGGIFSILAAVAAVVPVFIKK